MNGGETLEGYTATGCGSTHVTLALDEGGGASVTVRARWMGDDAPFEVTLSGRHLKRTAHHGVLAMDRAAGKDGVALEMPPSDGAILLEYVRVPVQEDTIPGNDAMAYAGTWNDAFRAVLWVHPDAMWDDGTQLSPDEYEVPPERFAPVVRALKWIERVWKLA